MSRTTDGATISASSALPATIDQAGYDAVTVTSVGSVVDVGEIGAVFADVTSYDLSGRDVIHLKGSRDWNETPITVDDDRTDAGQVILRDHHNGTKIDDPVVIKIEHQDGSTEYFQALVYSFTGSTLAQDTVYRATVSMRIVPQTYVYVAAP